MKKIKFLSTILAGVMIAGCLGGCGSSTSTSSGSDGESLDSVQELNTIMFDPLSFDTSACYDADSTTVLGAVEEGLTRISNDGTEDTIEPAGAESWEISDDGLEYTFKLRENKWSDGEEVVAQNYVDAVIRLLTASNAFPYAFFGFSIKNGEAFYNGEVSEDQVGIEAVDDHTLKITLEEAEPYFLSKISYTVFKPIRLDVIEKAGDSYGSDYTQLVYCGPFKIESYESGNELTLVKNDSYWDSENVKLDKINMTNVQEFATQAQLFESQQLDITGSTQEYVEKWTQEAEEGKWVARTGDIPTVDYMVFNQGTNGPSGLMGNAKIREAISLSIDREEYTSSLYGRFTPAYGLVPGAVQVGDDLYRDVAEEPLKAAYDEISGDSTKLQELLHEGLKELNQDTSDLSNITIEYLCYGTSELEKQRQEWLKQQLENKLGITVKVTVAGDYKLFMAAKNNLEYDIALDAWGADYNDPMTFFENWTSTSDNNSCGYSNSEYDSLIATLNGETDESKRLEVYEQLEGILMNDSALAPIFYRDTRQFIQNYVKDFQTPTFGSTYEFRWAYIEGKN